MKPIPFAEINRELVPKDPLEQAQFGAALFEKCRLAHNAEPKTPEGKRRQKTLWLPKIRAACKLIAEARMLLPEPKDEFDVRFDKRAFLTSDIGAKQLGLIDIGKSFEETPIHDTPDVDPLEDFTTYTEVDPNNRFSVTQHAITATNLPRNETAYIYRDCGDSYFDAFTHLYYTRVTDASDRTAAGGCWAVSTAIGTIINWIGSRTPALVTFWYPGAAPTAQLAFRDCEDGKGDTDYATLNMNTNYYLTIERNGSSALAHIFSNPERTVLVDTLSVSPSASVKYRYLFGAVSYADTHVELISYATYNLDIGGITFQPSWAEGINTHHF